MNEKKYNTIDPNSTNAIKKTLKVDIPNHRESNTETVKDDEDLFYESVTTFLANYQDKTLTDEFYLMLEDFQLHYYTATAIRLIMSTKDATVYNESIILSDAIDLLVRWREFVKDNHYIPHSSSNPMAFADKVFADPHDQRHIAITMIIKACITPDNDLADIYLDAAIALLNECIVPGTERSIERDR